MRGKREKEEDRLRGERERGGQIERRERGERTGEREER